MTAPSGPTPVVRGEGVVLGPWLATDAGRVLEILFEQPFDVGCIAGIQLDTVIPVCV